MHYIQQESCATVDLIYVKLHTSTRKDSELNMPQQRTTYTSNFTLCYVTVPRSIACTLAQVSAAVHYGHSIVNNRGRSV